MQVPVVRAQVVRAHNYSTQTLNSTELANEALRQLLQEVSDTTPHVALTQNMSRVVLTQNMAGSVHTEHGR